MIQVSKNTIEARFVHCLHLRSAFSSAPQAINVITHTTRTLSLKQICNAATIT